MRGVRCLCVVCLCAVCLLLGGVGVWCDPMGHEPLDRGLAYVRTDMR